MIQTLQAFARLLGIRPSDAEEAIRSERAARAVLSRRNLFAAGAAMASGVAFGFAAPEIYRFKHISFVIKGHVYGEADGVQIEATEPGRSWTWRDPVTGQTGRIDLSWAPSVTVTP